MGKVARGKQKLGRPAILSDAHKEHLIEAIDKRPEMVLEETMRCITSSFEGRRISKIALYAFVSPFEMLDSNIPNPTFYIVNQRGEICLTLFEKRRS